MKKGNGSTGFFLGALFFAAIAVLNFTGIYPIEFTLFEVIGIGSALTGIICSALALFLLVCSFVVKGSKGGKVVKALVILLILGVGVYALTTQGERAEERMESIAGTYTATLPDSAEQARKLLENIEAYEEEIALADLNSLKEVRVVWFGETGRFTFGYDVEATKACVREFYKNYFAALYAGRTALNEVYGTVLDDMNDREFYQYFAELYSKASMDELLDILVENAYDYNTMEVPYKTGTYEVKNGKIYLNEYGEEETYMDYVLEGDTLTLEFSGGAREYTRTE